MPNIKTLKRLILELSLLHKTGMPYKMADVQIVGFIHSMNLKEKEKILHELSNDIVDNIKLNSFDRRMRLLILVPLIAILIEEENKKEFGICKN